jgi:hypothetical protein
MVGNPDVYCETALLNILEELGFFARVIPRSPMPSPTLVRDDGQDSKGLQDVKKSARAADELP